MEALRSGGGLETGISDERLDRVRVSDGAVAVVAGMFDEEIEEKAAAALLELLLRLSIFVC